MHKYFLIPALVVALSVGLTTPVRATQPTTEPGTFVVTNHTQSVVKTADGNTFIAVVEQPVYAGAITGTATDTYTLVAHPNGNLTGSGVETCSSCTIGGRTGSYTAVFSFTGSGASFQGHLTFTGGSGGLANLHGEGTFQGTGTTGTTSISYHFDP